MANATSQHPDGRASPGAGMAGPENVGLLSAEAEAALFEPSDEEDISHSVRGGTGPGATDTTSATPAASGGGPPLPTTAALAPTTSLGTTSNGSIKPAVRSSSATPSSAGERTPRTPQRVRFDPNPTILHGLTPSGTATSFETSRPSGEERDGAGHRYGRDDDDDDLDDMRDSLDDLDFEMGDGSDDREGRQHRRPLLTGIEAPSVALANSPWGEDQDDVHSWAEAERSRPKSGLKAAFMNMANSIIGAGIIGQPYAFKQAGLLSGILLLVGLTIVVDWTICLIVVNSKLSGANSFQGTVEKCFGRSGLIAISLAQWLFAFGGMVAFGVIVGDSIPHVLQAVWPGLRDVPVLGLMTDRRVVIVVFILAISFPLTLYRDIAKVRPPALFYDCHNLKS